MGDKTKKEFSSAVSTPGGNADIPSRFEVVHLEGFGTQQQVSAFRQNYEQGAFGNLKQTFESDEAFVIHLTNQSDQVLSGLKQKAGAQGGPVVEGVQKLKEVYSELSRYFPEDELETRDGYVGILLASAQKPEDKFEATKEKFVYLRDKESGQVAGGTNFGIYLGDNLRHHNTATAHAVYTFVSPEFRRMGIATTLAGLRFGATEKFAEEAAGVKGANVAIFSEQNSPMKMTPEEYMADMKMAIDPCDRLTAWQKVGYRRTGFTYVQPPLGEGLEAVRMLDLHTHLPPSTRAHHEQQGMHPDIIKNHLKKFMDLSVIKEAGAFERDQDCRNMAAELGGLQSVSVVKDDIPAMKKKVYAVFDMMIQGELPNPERNPAFYERSLGAIINDQSYAALIQARVDKMTDLDVKDLQRYFTRGTQDASAVPGYNKSSPEPV